MLWNVHSHSVFIVMEEIHCLTAAAGEKIPGEIRADLMEIFQDLFLVGGCR
jgi:hypothetical protein